MKFSFQPKRFSSLCITLIRNLFNWMEKHILFRPKTNGMTIYIYKCIDSIHPKFIHDLSTTNKRKWRLRNVSILDQAKVPINNHGQMSFNTLRARQNGCHVTDDIFNCIFLNENVWFPIKISLKFVPFLYFLLSIKTGYTIKYTHYNVYKYLDLMMIFYYDYDYYCD